MVTLRLMKSLVPLRYTETFIGSNGLTKVRKNDYLCFLLKVAHK